MNTRQVKLADLRTAPPGSFLYCPQCRAEYSANPGDYWNMGNLPFQCNAEETHRLRNMRLVRRVSALEIIK